MCGGMITEDELKAIEERCKNGHLGNPYMMCDECDLVEEIRRLRKENNHLAIDVSSMHLINLSNQRW